MSGSCLLMRRSAFDSVNGFDSRYFMYMEDVDLGDRLGRAGWLNVFVPSAEVTHAKGHAAGKHPELMLPAHHESAYRFQADRHPLWWQAPLRWPCAGIGTAFEAGGCGSRPPAHGREDEEIETEGKA